MYQVLVDAAQVPEIVLPIPGGVPEGAFTLRMLSNEPKYGATVYILSLAPGSCIPAHLHKNATETFLFLDGDFNDAGTDYKPGTYFACEPNTVHGPHSTQSGCRLLVFQSSTVDATDFYIAE